MVCRLIQEKNIWFCKEKFPECHAGFLSAGECVYVFCKFVFPESKTF